MPQNGFDPDASAPAWTAWAYAGTTLVGAFLLFQIQPLISKYILPWFGGAPAVWTTCMLFFQIVLFAGYAYSHLLVARLRPRGQAIAQIVLLLAALAVLPIAPSDAWKPSGSASPTGRILLLLAATVGLPYFVLSTTSPLIQAWFSRSYPGPGIPYRSTRLSNRLGFARHARMLRVHPPRLRTGLRSGVPGKRSGRCASRRLCQASPLLCALAAWRGGDGLCHLVIDHGGSASCVFIAFAAG